MSPHHPPKLPVAIDYGKFARNLAEAQYAIGRLDGLQEKLPNPPLLMAPLTAKEATISSKIEGTQSTVSDVFLFEAGATTRHADVIEVSNYKKAMFHAIEELKSRPMNLNLIMNLHRILLHQARRQGAPGEFRREQAWVGEAGAPIEKASYVPPEWDLVPDYMDNLEEYMHATNEDKLVQAAILHYQFEAIHPFRDGNGRIGRLLIPVLLHSYGRMAHPILYMSGYFDRNRDQYIDTLHHVDETGEHEEWIKFFLDAVAEQSRETQLLIDKILALHAETEERLAGIKSPYVNRLIQFLFKKPIFIAPVVAQELRVAHRSTTIRLLDTLKARGVIREISAGRKRMFVFESLVRLL